MKKKFFGPLYPKQDDKEKIMLSATEMHDTKDKNSSFREKDNLNGFINKNYRISNKRRI